jgi:hypothetical protein
MKSKDVRKYYEDIFQEMLAQMLPDMDRSLIRASYQVNGGFAAKNEINDNYDDGVSGFSILDNVIYFRVEFTPGRINSEIDQKGNIRVLNFITLNINVYGCNSSLIALKIFSKVYSDDIMFFINQNGIYLTGKPNEIREMREVINRQIWERHDLTLNYNVEEFIENGINIKSKGIDIII